MRDEKREHGKIENANGESHHHASQCECGDEHQQQRQ